MTTETPVVGKGLIDEELFPTGDSTLSVLPERQFVIHRDYIEGLRVEVPQDIRDRLDRISQVALKDLWIGEKEVRFSRWHHSVGTYNKGLVWLKVLFDDKRIPAHLLKAMPSIDQITLTAGYSLLLHDYGHVFFSHLMEQALHEINWYPEKENVNALEDSSLRQKLINNDNPIKTTLEKILYDSGIDNPSSAIKHILGLIEGTSGFVWLQAIVNGPFDADKIDYLCRDGMLLSASGFPVTSRLNIRRDPHSKKSPWFTEFLSEQYVNHAGFLCLPGRSALAAADLLRERMFLYDRFYLAPTIRVADRIVIEILQQFFIRAVMSRVFSHQITTKPTGQNEKLLSAFQTKPFSSLASLVQSDPLESDIRETKYGACLNLMLTLMEVYGTTSTYDYELLEYMAETLIAWPQYDSRYRSMLTSLWIDLKSLCKGENNNKQFVKSHLVQQPLSFPKSRAKDVHNIVRSLQHQFSADVLLDMVVLPQALSYPLIPLQKK